ncbi:MAG TPA: hypothetical protein VHY22_06770 [Chthoniobacteraceae bacterium]|jgi:uncharacterized protein (TIGR02598 family)|nr:hypothetical protein [Chthoniobacteraceae bacterium]
MLSRLHRPRITLAKLRQGFTLIEVCLALGVVSFSLMTILAVIPVGLQTVQDSRVEYGMATITQQISSQLQGMPFTSSTSNPTNALDSIDGTSTYYTRDGVVTGATATGTTAAPFFVATFSTTGTSGTLPIPGTNGVTYPENLQLVKASVSYPYMAPAAARKCNVLSFCIAKQGNL